MLSEVDNFITKTFSSFQLLVVTFAFFVTEFACSNWVLVGENYYNIAELGLDDSNKWGFEESAMYCEFLDSHLFEPRDTATLAKVLAAIKNKLVTTGKTVPLWINAARDVDST